MIITVDGPAAAGKGTLSRRLAKALGLPYLDTGLLYRAVGRRVLDVGGDPADPGVAKAQARALQLTDLARADLRGLAADRAASQVAAISGVRAELLAFQRSFAGQDGAVLDGRDIGTVVFPDAEVKLFVMASLEVRAARRWRELQARGVAASLEAVMEEIRTRDVRDEARATAPLRPATNAVLLDTSTLSPDATFAAAMAVIAAYDTVSLLT